MRRRRALVGLGAAGLALGVRGRLAARPSSSSGGVLPAPSLTAALQEMGAKLGVRLTRFDRSHAAAAVDVPLDRATKTPGPVTLTLGDATVACRARITPANQPADAHDVELTFRVVKGRLPNAAVAATLSFGRWSRDAYVLIPGAVYGGNRFASRHMPFPPLLSEPSDIGPHVPTIISDVPRLNDGDGESQIVLGAADCAVPTVGVRLPPTPGDAAVGSRTRDAGEGVGVLLIAEPDTPVGATGLAITETDDRSHATISLAVPGVRPDFRYGVCNSRLPSADRGADLEMGWAVKLRFRLVVCPCPDVPSLYRRWFVARRDVLGPARLLHDLPLSSARRFIEERLAADLWIDDEGVFAARGATTPVNTLPTLGGVHLETGFRTGGEGALALAVPMLLGVIPESRKRSAALLELQFRGQAPSGLFHTAGSGSSWWDEGETSMDGSARTPAAMPRRRHWTHVGRNAEALHLGCKQILLLQRLDPAQPAPDAWRQHLRRSADALVRLWNRYDQLGQYAHSETGDVVVGGSTAGALAPAALALAARVLDSTAYLRTALAIADAFHERFIQSGLTLGGAEAALQCPDARSAAGLLESFVALAEATGDVSWFEKAGAAAHQLATWIVAWDAHFAEGTTLARLGARTTGAVLVSAQDKWAVPGFTASSGDALFRLYRATGNVAYLELLRETVHNSSSYVATPDRLPHPEGRPGWVAGRIAIGDATGAPGEVPDGTPAGSAQTSCLLAALEIPALYIQPDTGFCFSFDHVDARVSGRTRTTLTVSVRNTTAYEADLRVFSEMDGERVKPLDAFPLLGARELTLGPGAHEDLEFARAKA